ncbi:MULTISPECIES: hypothetical protein [unclassified Gordonia (in: high G+C Gram-positive bacteria)]|uniref:hypothetical protein n=2 Tax=Gordonia TaxID=2053 RepID=UPI000AB5F120|nr:MULTISPECIES: hypothetical protein [unclassified Gordonia (in: high G+C Gram-positive bacteria)]
MPACSPAYSRWCSERCAALDSLEHVHSKMTGKRRGRQYATDQLNLALFVSLAAQFQGYCRDLHDDAAVQIALSLVPGSERQAPVVLNALVRSRKLDVGNASTGGIGNDFAVLGMPFWPNVKAAYPSKGPKWNATLDSLNVVRNAVAHSQADKLADVRREQPLSLATFKKWRSSLNGAASGFDSVVGAYLQNLTGTGWD